MSVVKALALLCCAFSLVVQVAAHAAAVPQPQTIGMDCAEMTQAMPQYQMNDQDNRSDGRGCCPDMSLDCLVVMNCLSPLAMTASNSFQPTTCRLAPSYLSAVSRMLKGEPPPPESPPPQSSSIG